MVRLFFAGTKHSKAPRDAKGEKAVSINFYLYNKKASNCYKKRSDAFFQKLYNGYNFAIVSAGNPVTACICSSEKLIAFIFRYCHGYALLFI